MKESVISKIWNIIYPVLLYFVLNLLLAAVIQAVIAFIPSDISYQERVNDASPIISVIFLAVSIVILYFIYKHDHVISCDLVLKKPYYLAVLFVMGILASHGLSALVSLSGIDSLSTSYTQIQDSLFNCAPVLVILRTCILAPISEELLFRGLVYNRLFKYTKSFWASALISSAIFGIYHLNLAQGVFAFIFGILLALVYNKTDNFWSVAITHCGGNVISVVIVYTGFSYPEMWLCVLAMICVLAAACALYYFLIRPLKKNDR